MNASSQAAREQRDASIDRDAPVTGRAKTARVDLGLALLSVARKPGAQFTIQEIAMWCGCTRDAILISERKALKKIRNRMRFGALRRVTEELVS